MLRPLTTTTGGRPLLLLLRRSRRSCTRALTTTPLLRRDSIIPPSLKHTAKAIDHVASAAALKGIEAGESLASVARSAISAARPKSSPPSSSSSSSLDQPVGSDMYGEQDLRTDSISEVTRGTAPSRAAQEATGDLSEVVGRAKETQEEARKTAREAKERMSKAL